MDILFCEVQIYIIYYIEYTLFGYSFVYLQSVKNKMNKMKDQRRLLHKCMHAEIPVFVLCGSDACAVDSLKAYYEIARARGCTSEFLEDLQLLINDFELFQREEPEKIELPD